MPAYGDQTLPTTPTPLQISLAPFNIFFETIQVGAGWLGRTGYWLNDSSSTGEGDTPVRVVVYDSHGAYVTESDIQTVPQDSSTALYTFTFPRDVYWHGGPLLFGVELSTPKSALLLCEDASSLIVKPGRQTWDFGYRPDPLPDMTGPASGRPYTFVVTSGRQPVPDIPEEELAAYGWNTAQRMLAGPVVGAPMATTVEWHHTALDERIGAFAVAREGGPLESLVGDVVRITYGSRHAFVYVADVADLEADLSLARRAFFALADLALDEIQATLEVTGAT